MVSDLRRTCVSCALGSRSFARQHREFLLQPGTIVTLASLLLLITAAVHDPGGILGHSSSQDASPLYLAAALVGSVYIWYSALQGIREGDFTADIPVSLATAAALAIGQYSAAAVVAALLLLGGLLESFAAARAGKALEALARLLPDRVTVRREGEDLVVSLEELQVGDLLLIRSGERIAVDGVIESGGAAVNQAAITGESVPVEKRAGDQVYAGSLSEVGALEVRATRVGEETTLGQIRRMVAEAEGQKAPIERLLDRYAKFYTPAAILLGAFLWWLTGDVLRAITVLIVFCPCVMVLATPTALVASIGNAAMRGSLVKRGATLEALAKVDTVAFDKTGTLTFGQPRLVEVLPLNGMPPQELLRLAAIAEKFSEHPLGRAVLRAAGEAGLPVHDPEEFEVLPGMGVRARVDGSEVLLGQPRLFAEQDARVHPEGEGGFATLVGQGRSALVASLDGKPLGTLVLEDGLRPEARDALLRFGQLGIRTILITGDNEATGKRIAAELGIGEVHCGVLPHQKVEILRRLQAEGRRVAFVGDGVNDGPALAAADVGVAMGLVGTDVAIETAEIALLSDDLSKLPHLFLLSRTAIGTIQQNLVFSLGVLTLAIGLTFIGLLTPVTGALLHELSSLPVIANSARLIAVKSSN